MIDDILEQEDIFFNFQQDGIGNGYAVVFVIDNEVVHGGAFKVSFAKDVLLNITKEILPIEKIYSVKEERKLVRRKRVENIDLFIIGLKFGDILYFCKDQNIICKVISNKTVLFEGQELTLTEAARKTGLIRQKEIQGPKYWMINGKSLVTIRQEFERVI